MGVTAIDDQIALWASGHGFKQSPRRGFLGFARTGDDGVEQRLDMFRWSNAKAAATAGVPRSYLVVLVTTGLHPDPPRVRIPLVEWPSEAQPARSWVEVGEELDEIIMPFMGASADHLECLVQDLYDNERNLLV